MTDTERIAQLEAQIRKYEAALKVYQMLFTQAEIRDRIEVLNAYHPRVPQTTTEVSLQSAGSNAIDAAAQAERGGTK